MTLRGLSGLPLPGQGRCVTCGHYALIHGVDKCGHLKEWEGDAPHPPDESYYCKCDGFEPAPFVECVLCHRTVQCKVMEDLTVYKPFAWKFGDESQSLQGLCPGCQ